MPAAAGEFLRAARHRGGRRLEPGFPCWSWWREGRLLGEQDDRPIRQGETLVIPYAAGALRLDGSVEAIRLSASA